MLSEENKKRAKQGLDLIVDEEWIKIFPEDKIFRGQTIPLEHITQEAQDEIEEQE